MKVIEFLLSIPKSFYVSLRLTGIKKAFRLPIYVRYNCKIINLDGCMLGGVKVEL